MGGYMRVLIIKKILFFKIFLISLPLNGCAALSATKQIGDLFYVAHDTVEEAERNPNVSKNVKLPDGRWRAGYNAK
jgi:hypothetical protein